MNDAAEWITNFEVSKELLGESQVVRICHSVAEGQPSRKLLLSANRGLLKSIGCRKTSSTLKRVREKVGKIVKEDNQVCKHIHCPIKTKT